MALSADLSQNGMRRPGIAGRCRRDRGSSVSSHRLIASLATSAIICAFACPSVGIAAQTAAVSDPAPVAAATSVPVAEPDLIAQITDRLKPLISDDMRLQSVSLACTPPPGASLAEVAPGITRLESRGFLVELTSGARRLVCGATLTAQRQVVTAAHDLVPGAAVTAGDLRQQWVDAFRVSNGVLTTIPSEQPMVTVGAIRSGEPIYQSQLTRPLAVHPGDLVMVLIKNGPVTLRTQLEARVGAAVGDSATLVNPSSGTPVSVVVTGAKTAELVLE